MGLTPTPEQQAIIEAYQCGENLVINAYAGSGKTTILRLLAEADPYRKFLYIAYNKSAKLDAAKTFPRNARCYTSHGLAYRPMIDMASQIRPGSKYVAGARMAKFMKITGPVRLTKDRVLAPGQFASVVKATIRKFCYSADETITRWHVPNDLKRFTEEEVLALRQQVPTVAQRIWDEIVQGSSDAPVEHDYYLKSYALTHPRLPGEVIALDEAQDSNPCIAAMVREQAAYGTQIIMVGDTYQQIYEWRGAVDAMASFGEMPGVTVLPLTQCQPAGTMVRVPVELDRRTACGGPRPVGWREVPIETIREGDTVVSWSRKKGARARGRRVTSVATRPHDGPLVVAQVGDMVTRYAANHECIVVLGGRLADGDHVVYLQRRHGQYRVGRCPWHYGNGNGPIRRAVRERADAMWALSVHPTESDAALAEALTCVEFSLPGVGWQQDSHYKMPIDTFWAKVGDNGPQAMACLRRHNLLIDYPLWTATAGERPGGGQWRTHIITAAANLRSGMLMRRVDQAGTGNGSEQGYLPWSAWTPITVTTQWYTGTIYSLSVDVDHTYIADGVATHNSFRFGPAIAAEANKWLTILGAPHPIRGFDKIRSRTGKVAGPCPDAVLCRTNAEAFRRAIEMIGQDLKVAFPKGAGELTGLVKGAADIKAGRPCEHPDLMAFATWGQVQAFVEEEPDGADLKLFVDLVDQHGVDELFAILQQIGSEDRGAKADVTISTAHSAKGREWAGVEIADDFTEPKRDPEAPADQLPEVPRSLAMLAYVAITRGQYVVDRGGLAWVDHYLPGAAGESAAGPELALQY